MAIIRLEALRHIDGHVVSALVDSDSGMMLAGHGTLIDPELAAATATEVVRAQRRVASGLKLNDSTEDMLISLTKQFHLFRPLESNPTLFLYVILDRAKATLAAAQHELRCFEKQLDFS